MKHTSLEHRCPHCGRINDTASHHEGAVPKHGDVSICWKCGGVAVFEDSAFGMSSRLPTADELADIMQNPEVQSAISAIGVSKTPLEAVGRISPREES